MVADTAVLEGTVPRGPKLAHHFETMEKQVHAARFGVWVFLGSESLLFAALFGGYSVYRTLNESAFALCSRELNITLGTVNTLLLITSSFTVALAGYFIHKDKRITSAVMIFLSLLMGLGFLVVKGFEWTADFREGALPGKWFHLEGIPQAGGSQFFSLYFLLTGLHGLHVIIGMGLLVWAMAKVLRRTATSQHDLPVEVSGLYWHLVDLIWIFLYPLLYLV
jgi:cytochrome c oxidase subunit 3